jgi:hypothetical protein
VHGLRCLPAARESSVGNRWRRGQAKNTDISLRGGFVKRIALLVAMLVLTATLAEGQSLKSSSPAPLQAGVNEATTDNFTGTHYWYFYGGPGTVVLHATLKGMGMMGSPMNTRFVVTLSDAAGSFQVSKVLVSGSNQAPATGTFDGKLKTRTRLIVSVAPPSQALVRMGGTYDLEASGAVAFGVERSLGDPIVQTFYGDFGAPSGQGAGGTQDYGATKFRADGSIVCANGASGTWKLFDAGTRVYSIVLDGQHYSLKYEPGRGLIDAGNDSQIVFKLVK